MPRSPLDPALDPTLRDDWRVGPVVYQVFPDRFVPPDDPGALAARFPAPRRPRSWRQRPRKGRYLPELGVWSHELDFWGGDLHGVRRRLDHVAGLADVLYLNPVTPALTNHRYDPWDWAAVDPALGGEAALEALIADASGRGLEVVLDGVFNHMGRAGPRFQRALAGEGRGWFDFDPAFHDGYRAWADVKNLPAVRLEAPEVQAAAFAGPGSAVQRWLRAGVGGWRLDVAHDLGPSLLSALRAAAREARADAWVVGEVWNYPEGWLSCLDGVLNMFLRRQVLSLVRGELSPMGFGRDLGRLVGDCGLAGLLRSWLVLDNHDTPRLASELDEPWQRRLARVLQFTLPGAPVIYYGAELGLSGGHDPENRGPMPWSRVRGGDPALAWMRALVGLRRGLPSLRYGALRVVESERLVGFVRRTERVAETAVVLVNPGPEAVSERVTLRAPRLMSGTPMRDRLAEALGAERVVVGSCDCGTLPVTVAARSAVVLAPEMPPETGHSAYRRL
jgi:cyclomaltodextrinase